MLASLYMAYIIVIAKLKPSLAPVPPIEERTVVLSSESRALSGGQRRAALPRLVRAAFSGHPQVPRGRVFTMLSISVFPLAMAAALFAVVWGSLTEPVYRDTSGLQEIGATGGAGEDFTYLGVQEPPSEEAEGATEPKAETGLAEPPPAETGLAEPPPAETGLAEPPGAEKDVAAEGIAAQAGAEEIDLDPRRPAPLTFWIALAAAALLLAGLYVFFTFERYEVLKMLMTSFFPLSALILAVLGSIVFGWATPTEAAALGAAGAMVLTALYRRFTFTVLKESVFLCAKTTAMVCWLFIGSSIFSAAFALLGGQGLIERWVLGMDLTAVQFMLLAQVIIFFLGWPLEWTEIIVIFMPIFIPLLGHFQIDPLFFGLLVAMNLQTAFLSPPVAMAAFYLKGVAPPHVRLNQIFAGMMPFMAIQVFALFLLYMFPGIGLWLPQILYR
jgi:TRAP-type mannitol/chloroaromatic compound transport system permease large subunit